MEAKEKAAEKIRQRAMQWHEEKDSVQNNDPSQSEISFIKELKETIAMSGLERKIVYLTALAEQEKRIEKGLDAVKLPEIVRNLIKKKEIRDRTITLAKKYRANGEQLYYLWGLE